jgi:hypothetical protein
MTEREKELGELNDLIFKHSSEGSLGLLAREIQQAGYTKKHFPVEKLERRIREVQQEFTDDIDDESLATVSISAMAASANCDEVLKFIKELKGE